MKLLTKLLCAQLLENGCRQEPLRGTVAEMDFVPVVKLFTPDANCTWLLTELDPEDADIAFGLCDLGLGFPELGTVRISELESIRGPLGLPIERDRYIVLSKSLAAYASDARDAGRITA